VLAPYTPGCSGSYEDAALRVMVSPTRTDWLAPSLITATGVEPSMYTFTDADADLPDVLVTVSWMVYVLYVVNSDVFNLNLAGSLEAELSDGSSSTTHV